MTTDSEFMKRFWDEKIAWKEAGDKAPGDHKAVRIDGKHYLIAPENSPVRPRGFGGSRFVIDFFDGTRVVTTNLWHQGTIPEDYLERLPDNAVFVKESLS